MIIKKCFYIDNSFDNDPDNIINYFRLILATKTVEVIKIEISMIILFLILITSVDVDFATAVNSIDSMMLIFVYY